MEDTQNKTPVPARRAPNAPAAETQQAASQQPAQPVPPSAAAQPAQVTQATSVPPTAPQAMAPAVKNSGKAIASLVCGIVGRFIRPVLGTIALVMGVWHGKETAPVGPYRGRAWPPPPASLVSGGHRLRGNRACPGHRGLLVQHILLRAADGRVPPIGSFAIRFA